MMLTGSIIPPEPPVPSCNTGWMVIQHQQWVGAGMGEAIATVSPGLTLEFDTCHIMNKRTAQRICNRLQKQGMAVEMISVAEYKRRLIARKLSE